MGTQVGALMYPGADIVRTGAAAALPAEAYPDWASLRAAIEGASPVLGQVVEFPERTPDRPFRFDLTMGIVATAGTVTADEDLYVVSATALDEKAGLLIEKAADLVWTGSLTAPVPASIGGRTNHKWPTSVTLTDSGLAEARSGVRVRTHNGKPAVASVFDAGSIVGLVRMVGATGSATAVGPMLRRWL